MSARKDNQRRRRARSLLVGAVVGAGAMSVTTLAAGATVGATGGPSAFFALGVLTVVGDAQNNTIVISRDAAGKILVNNGAVQVTGGTPTVANTRSISVVGAAGNDVLTPRRDERRVAARQPVRRCRQRRPHRRVGRRHAGRPDRQRHPARQGWVRRDVRWLRQRRVDRRRCRRPGVRRGRQRPHDLESGR